MKLRKAFSKSAGGVCEHTNMNGGAQEKTQEGEEQEGGRGGREGWRVTAKPQLHGRSSHSAPIISRCDSQCHVYLAEA